MLDLAMTDAAGAAALTSGGLIEPEDAADAVVEGIRAEQTLILTHENVAGFMALKAAEPERWLRGHAPDRARSARRRAGRPETQPARDRAATLAQALGAELDARREAARAGGPQRAPATGAEAQRHDASGRRSTTCAAALASAARRPPSTAVEAELAAAAAVQRADERDRGLRAP